MRRPLLDLVQHFSASQLLEGPRVGQQLPGQPPSLKIEVNLRNLFSLIILYKQYLLGGVLQP